MTVWLFEYGSGRPFAFSSDGGASWFTPNGRPWAFRGDNGRLYSYEGGSALGWFVDKTFFSVGGKLLYFTN